MLKPSNGAVIVMQDLMRFNLLATCRTYTALFLSAMIDTDWGG
jgi:hypothetical protein